MDSTDEANECAELFLKNAIDAALTKKSEAYLEIEGIHCCVDCEAGIPDNRLKANPGAVRCIKCQRAEEFKPLK